MRFRVEGFGGFRVWGFLGGFHEPVQNLPLSKKHSAPRRPWTQPYEFLWILRTHGIKGLAWVQGFGRYRV